jgi:tRNA/rRNA methyltransferase
MSRLHVVLHRPIYPRNTGMCARAIGNMGADRLIVVSPQFDMNEEEAKQGAAHAQKTLRDATVYKDIAQFYENEGEGVRLALSGRDGRLKQPDYLENALAQMREDETHQIHSPTTPIYLFFGPEDDGLSNEEMALCHHVCRLPNFGPITSLNLSHAVLLTLYMVQSSLRGASLVTNPSTPATMALEDPAPAYYPSDTIKRWLEALGFDLSARRVSIEKTLNHILLSRCPKPDELRIIDAVLQQTVRKLLGP